MSAGYGQLIRRGVHIAAHRLSWFVHKGIIPPRKWVLHDCDNPPCVRLDHLFLGTRQDNIDDMIAKGRDRKAIGDDHWMNANPDLRLVGERNGRTILGADDVREIRRRAGNGESVAELAREIQMSEGALRHIVKRRNWRHIT